MKKALLSWMATMLLCINANAQIESCCDCCYIDCVDSHPFYAEIFGGANFQRIKKSRGIESHDQTGCIISGSIGYQSCYGLRLEGEYAFRRNSLKGMHFLGRSFDIHGHFKSFSYMANLLWDLPLSSWGCAFWKIQPFIGGGIGYDCQQIKMQNVGLTFKDSKRHFAWQVIAGFGYPLFCDADISLEYKYHQGGFTHIHNHSVGVGLTYNFGSFIKV